ncbi:peptidase domain-containing ABC transporter [Dyadobacter pollutisoli]|uniref:Peptidase domain-containing ABC transporter n=1 Tax=Dyadobacter pollutisoli TaxID=2910158 RepID=A0A9E8SPN5_9BACT|nr:peptidase domain-containing ABC transporter [Dyadobacter pollutisoli]WAC14911.1 peptidase domain-containing ABC transporter [Dyadobacter pollutisoli]
MKNKYKFFRQLDYMDCGPTCLRMVTAFYGKDYSLDFFRANAHIGKNGVSLNGLCQAAEKIGIKTLPVKLSYEQLATEVPLPCILHWNQEHYVVLYDVKEKNIFRKESVLIVADPGHGLVKVDKKVFMRSWASSHDEKGVALLLEPTPEFYDSSEEHKQTPIGFKFLFQYLRPYKRYLVQIFLGMLLGSLISVLFPFLTQSLVDYGIQLQNYNFIHLVLFSQLLLFLGNIGVDMIRNWILLHVNTRLSVSIISNFLTKLMKLPINFFESKNVGDISQRINDHHRIEEFLTGSTLNTLFSLVNLLVFSVVLSTYNISLLGIFFIGSIISVSWVFVFLNRRKNLDYMRFQRLRENQNSIYELITGMQEIKLNNCEQARRWEWERIQAKLFKISVESLSLEQYQEIGANCITQIKNILISYLAAKLVMEQQITLGAMLSISYIIGQMNGPLNQIMNFVKKVQDAKISLDRLGEIHNKPNEELDEEYHMQGGNLEDGEDADILKLNSLESDNKGIVLNDVSFRYGSSTSPLILKNVSMHIPKGKVTAIVGSSGSGKTTLLKLLLRFYPLSSGQIVVDGEDLDQISAKAWRKDCGTVMQDGFIFSDTIARNIAVDGQRILETRMKKAIHVANLQDYIKKLPLGFTTRIGNTGAGISGGQRQRLFIARAVYKDPKYMFFDEATSALDANNEKIIMENLDEFFKGKTVVVIAHRLSTVKNADQIVVLHNGEIREVGTHQELTAKKGYYFELVKNQLELGAA